MKDCESEQREEMPEYCVTGGTGYIAAFLIKALLEKGHTVRTTVRDPGIYMSNIIGFDLEIFYHILQNPELQFFRLYMLNA